MVVPFLEQVSSRKEDDDQHGFPTLCSTTFVVWYRVLVRDLLFPVMVFVMLFLDGDVTDWFYVQHEENLTVLNKLVSSRVCH